MGSVEEWSRHGQGSLASQQLGPRLRQDLAPGRNGTSEQAKLVCCARVSLLGRSTTHLLVMDGLDGAPGKHGLNSLLLCTIGAGSRGW